ncbi:MAG TPA: hypothetical protein VLF91_04740 [Candidatus Saccharimonadales bacterium]|nr:hypothetical protein [Candidatus Saccharimonadales bacterium]
MITTEARWPQHYRGIVSDNYADVIDATRERASRQASFLIFARIIPGVFHTPGFARLSTLIGRQAWPERAIEISGIRRQFGDAVRSSYGTVAGLVTQSGWRQSLQIAQEGLIDGAEGVRLGVEAMLGKHVQLQEVADEDAADLPYAFVALRAPDETRVWVETTKPETRTLRGVFEIQGAEITDAEERTAYLEAFERLQEHAVPLGRTALGGA